MEIPKTIDKKLISKHDLAIFKMLIRTLKESGLIYKFKSTQDIIKKCYWSRGYYCPEGESKYRNISLWSNDALNLIDKSKTPLDDETRMLIKIKFNGLILEEVLLKNKIYSQEFMTSFFETLTWCNGHKLLNKRKSDITKFKPIIERCSKYLKHYPKHKYIAEEVDKIIEKWQ